MSATMVITMVEWCAEKWYLHFLYFNTHE